MPQYRRFIEDKFLIDHPETGELVPFKFRAVQNKYYDLLVKDYDIENKGLSVPIRENIAKSRRHGFSAIILALFAADDCLSTNPTEGAVISYKDDATRSFRKRYRNYILTYFALELGLSREQIQANPEILEKLAGEVFDKDEEGNYILKHNKAHFTCGTASARVAGRGGVLQKLHFSETAFYPDTAAISAAGMIEGTMRQVDPAAGWIFSESTDGGPATYQAKLWKAVEEGTSRFRNRFFGWRELYSQEEYEVIASESIDPEEHRRDYPETTDDLFKGTSASFVTHAQLEAMQDIPEPQKEIVYMMELQGVNYIDQVEIITHTLETLVQANPNRGLYAGIDVAKIKDATTVKVLGDRRHDITGGVKAIAIDSTGSDWMADWFERNTPWYVIRVKFSRMLKDLMYRLLQTVIIAQQTSLPVLRDGKVFISDEYRHFFDQMTGLTKRILGNLLVVEHPKGSCSDKDHDYTRCPYHDDYPDAWALAEHAFMTLNGVTKREKKPEIPTVDNAITRLLQNKKKRGGRFGSAGDYM